MKKMTLEEFADRAGEYMQAISREYFHHHNDDIHKVKITLPQMVVLETLRRHGELNMTDLAGALKVTTAAMTGLSDRLVRDGYAKRVNDPDDRRVVKIKLTAKGINMADHMAEQKKKTVMKIFGMISQEERQKYLEILEHIKEHLGE